MLVLRDDGKKLKNPIFFGDDWKLNCESDEACFSLKLTKEYVIEKSLLRRLRNKLEKLGVVYDNLDKNLLYTKDFFNSAELCFSASVIVQGLVSVSKHLRYSEKQTKLL